MIVKLEDVCFSESSNLKQSDVTETTNGYPVYGASGFIGNIDKYKQEKEYISIVKDGAGIGRVQLCPGKSSVIGTMQYIIPKENILPKYLYYVTTYMHLEKYYTGATIPHIYFKDYKKEKFHLDSIEKQENIINILNKCCRMIELRKKQLQEYDSLIKARFIEMFGDPIINTKKWDECTIGELTTDVRYGTSKPSVNGGKYPYLRMNNLTSNGGLDLSDLKYIDVSDDEKEKCVVRKGDVLFNRTNSIDLVGKTAMFNLNEEMIIAGYIIRIRLNNRLLPEILSYYMNSSALKKLLRKMAKGAVNQANINAQELQSIKVYVPDLELQKEFISFVQQVDKSKYDDMYIRY